MFDSESLNRTRPADCSEAEWRARVELAACYRVFAHRGWVEEIFNHITLRVPGPDKHFLINPFGLHYTEVTAHNLMKIDLDGRPVGAARYPVNVAGFVIHSAIHGAREDAHCVIHTHHTPGLAVACKEEGLAMDNFYAAFLYGRIAYHDFEGVTVHTGEQERLLASLGDKPCLILRNHGLLVADPTLAGAFYWMYILQRACEVQAMTHAMAGPTRKLTQQACEVSSRGVQASDPEKNLFPKVFEAAVRSAGVTLEMLTRPA